MASGDYERIVQQSLLDRLIDYEPDSRVEPLMTRAESLRRLRSSVRRDLEWLLNTVRVESVPPSFTELQKSVFAYGVVDISGMSLESPQDGQRLLRSLEAAITLFEPRLKNVRVTSYDKLSRKRMTLDFHVEALLMIDPAPERIAFDTIFEVARGMYTVKE
ncbi:MAG: type VI secretion system baseplate subunit TssE [Acidobacteriaceae bacterium]|nr:type VI secretion system baseplate subunit TssE [Acidobacteriaceae bacterium]